ncbi:MAG: acyl-ACP desaturase, partial [Acidimicrobiales bacterium]
VTRAIDPVALERGRMAQVSGGVAPTPETVGDTLVYVALQELATRISHMNTAKLLDDKTGHDVMARVAADENLHHLFYRDVTAAALELEPSGMVEAIERQVRSFAMPGVGVPDFAMHASRIANAGIYDFAEFHERILLPVVLGRWKLEVVEGLSAAAERARDRLLHRIGRIGTVARRVTERRGELAAT